MKFKVPIFGASNKFAWLDEKATDGARVGVNLVGPDGKLVSAATWKRLLSGATGGSQSAIGTTDDLDEGRWNLYFTDRRAQDAVGEILEDSDNVTLTYTPGSKIVADLTDITDSGAGALLAITVDAKGRVTGTRDATINGTAGRITVAHGDASDGLPTIDLAEVTDSGGGALLKISRDAWGRVAGTSQPDTGDLPEGSNLYYTDARADSRIEHAKGQPDGIASLVGGKLDPGQLPDLAITETFVVNSEAEMLALTCEQGDVAVRTDESKSYILTTDDPSQAGNWQELLSPTGGVTSFNGRTGAVVPASGDYKFSQIADKPTTLAGYGITDAATAGQGAKADSALQPGDDVSDLANDAGYVDAAGAADAAPVQSVNGQTGDVVVDSGMAPMRVLDGDIFTVPENRQCLFFLPIALEGSASLNIEGSLTEVGIWGG